MCIRDSLNGIDEAGLAAYVAETEYSAVTANPGLIVNEARKAMSLLSAAFYGYPQNELTGIGVTGTKGKTTTSYFTQALINAVSGGKAALFSSVDNCLDPQKSHRFHDYPSPPVPECCIGEEY